MFAVILFLKEKINQIGVHIRYRSGKLLVSILIVFTLFCYENA